MTMQQRDIVANESYLARRVGRLFRFESAGCFARRRPDVGRRLLERRGELIDALIRADIVRRNLQMPISAELKTAVGALWREVAATRSLVDARLDTLRTNLAIVFGEGIPSGVRGVATGPVLGRG